MAQKTNYQIAAEVIEGKWGNGMERYELLTKAGYSYDAVQSIVNVLIQDRNRAAVDRAFEKMLTVEVDLDEYSGINLKFKKKG
ncbi:MAG: hypothetical protein J6V49_02900 [Bacteroidales bacterium]|nr:hypothetical protein [Bacteroidales bacterium]MBP5709901.1 hypothetical protein [Bacteroidales bacterium]